MPDWYIINTEKWNYTKKNVWTVRLKVTVMLEMGIMDILHLVWTNKLLVAGILLHHICLVHSVRYVF